MSLIQISQLKNRGSSIEIYVYPSLNYCMVFSGIHGWIVYSLVGLLLGLMAYRENLPMTMKSCFYPLIGDRIFGWMGDLIDVVSIMTTLFGVCTSLGLGTRQLNAGLNMINSDIPADDTTIQVCNWIQIYVGLRVLPFIIIPYLPIHLLS